MNPKLRAVLWAVLTVVILGGFYITVDNFSDRLAASEAQAREDTVTARIERQKSERKVEALARQLEQLGAQPIVEPDDDVPLSQRYVPIPGPRGPAGPTGPTGRSGTPGAPGAAGDDGSTGAAGQTGPAGPKGDTGAKGDTGDRGPAGADGRGISNLQCGDDGRWTVTYTDGTSEDAGACRILAAPES